MWNVIWEVGKNLHLPCVLTFSHLVENLKYSTHVVYLTLQEANSAYFYPSVAPFTNMD